MSLPRSALTKTIAGLMSWVHALHVGRAAAPARPSSRATSVSIAPVRP